MEARNNNDFTIQEFGDKAQELIHIMLALCEERIHTVPILESHTGKAMADAAMSVQYAVQTFIAVARLHGK